MTQNGSHMHWNKQKDLKVMLEPKRSCTLLPGIHCIIFLLHTIETLWINYECLIYGYTLIQFSYSSIMNIITLLMDWSKVKTLSRRSSNHIYNSQKAFSEVIFNDTFHVTTVRRFYFATAVFALFLCEILIKFYTQWQF